MKHLHSRSGKRFSIFQYLSLLIIALVIFIIAAAVTTSIQNIQPVKTSCNLTGYRVIIKVNNPTDKEITRLSFDVETDPWTNNAIFQSRRPLGPGDVGYYSFTFPEPLVASSFSLSKCGVDAVVFSNGTNWQSKSFIIWP
jgi:hypothetical protein